MIHQEEFDDPIKTYGCYFLCLCFLRGLKTKEEIEKHLNYCNENGWVGDDSFIIKPYHVLTGEQKTIEKISYRKAEYCCKEGEKEILELKNGNKTHFVIGDSSNYNKKDWMNHIIYDPLAHDSAMLNNCILDSKRVFLLDYQEEDWDMGPERQECALNPEECDSCQ